MNTFEKIRLALSGAIVGHAVYGLFDRYHEHYWPELVGFALVLLWAHTQPVTLQNGGAADNGESK